MKVNMIIVICKLKRVRGNIEEGKEKEVEGPKQSEEVLKSKLFLGFRKPNIDTFDEVTSIYTYMCQEPILVQSRLY